MKILIINGPNLNLLGKRNSEFYGSFTLQELEKKINLEFPQIDFTFFQANDEAKLIEQIQKWNEYHGIIINPGAYSHYSVAIRDALEIAKLPKILVHISNISNRESFRLFDIISLVCDGCISGFKEESYFAAIFLLKRIQEKGI